MDGPLRILRVIARLNVGGPALHVAHLSNGLRQRGYETTLAAGSVGTGEGSMEYVAEELGVKPLLIPGLRRDVAPLQDAASVAQILRLIRELQPHILHTHTAKAGAVGRAAAMLAGRDRPKVVLHTFHGHVLRGYFGFAATEMFRQLERGFAQVSDALIAVSPEVRDDLVRLGVAPAEKVVVVRLGLDLDERLRAPDRGAAFRASLGISDQGFVVGWLGRMTEIKRVDVLIGAFAQLLRSGCVADLVLVGDGPQRLQLEAYARKLGVAERTHFVGFHAEVGDVYAALDAVALSSANEGTPVSIIEALAAGKPVVSTRVGGVADVVEEGRSGFLVAPEDTSAIADRLGRLARDGALRTAFGEAGRRFVVPRYSIPRLLDDVDLLYRELLRVRAPTRRRVVDRVSRPLVPALSSAALRTRPPRRRLHVILVSQYFPPEVGATQSRMQAFAEHLAARGHRVTVICEFPNHPHGVIPPEFRGRAIVDDRSNDYRILRVWVRARHEKSQATRLQFYLSFMAMAALAAPLAGRADVVVATSPPLFTGLAGWIVAEMNRAPFVLDVRDLWPAAAVSLDQISGGVVRYAGEFLERWLYRRSAAVTAVTRPFCQHIDRLRRTGPPAVLVPNGTLDLFFAEADGFDRDAVGIGRDRFLVTFAGMHGIAQGLPSVLDAAELLAGRADFLLVGDGPVKDRLVAAAEQRGLDNVHFLPQVPLEEIPPVLAASDALLVPLSSHPTFRDFVPSKMVDFMAAGRPVLLSAAGEAARLLELSGGGISVEPENSEQLAESALWLAEHPEAARAMAGRGREFARKRVRSVQARRLEELLLDVAGR